MRVNCHETNIYPSDDEAKRQIVEVCKMLYKKNFVVSNDGNVSYKVSDTTLWYF